MTFDDSDLAGGGNFIGVGIHTVKVTEVKKAKSAAGNDKIEVVVKNDTGKERTLHLALTPKAKWKIASIAKACGHTDEYLKSGEFLPSKDLPGKKFKLTVEQTGTEMYNGEEKKRYAEYFDVLDGAQDQAADEEDLPF